VQTDSNSFPQAARRHAIISCTQPLGELGLDSLLAVELRTAYSRRIERRLSTTLAFDYPTVAEQAQFVLDKVLGLAADTVETTATDEIQTPSTLSGLSDDDLIARLETHRARLERRSS
jgi:hypothetical protein